MRTSRLSWVGLSVGVLLAVSSWAAPASPNAGKKSKTSPKGKVVTAAPNPAASPADSADRYQNLELFQKVLSFVESNYVETTTNKDLIQGAIKGMLATLDPHSNFLNQDVFRDMKVDTQGKFGGLGIEVGVRDGVLTVISPMEDTPAWKAGLKPGDRLLKIDGVSTKGLTITDAVTKMRGKMGQRVNLQFIRKGFDRPREVTLERAMIRVNPVRWELLEPGYGYVRLKTFNEAAAKEVKAALDACEKKGKIKGIVLDLRANPGGLLDQAVDVASLFYDEGVVVSTIGRNKEQMEVRHAKKGMARKDFHLAVLVDGSTASAAEIVAGAIQDQKRGIVVGQQTFGKGSVQTVIELGQEMGLKLTIARYYTPSGRSIQEKGVTPDIRLDAFDPKLLSKAKLKVESYREKDIPGHIVNDEEDGDGGEYSTEELRTFSGATRSELEKPNEKAGGDEEAEDPMAPLKFEPKKDTQVQESLRLLKSYQIFSARSAEPAATSGAK